MFRRWTLFVPIHAWAGLGQARDPHASSPASPSSVRGRWLSPPALLHVGGYAALILFFRWIDVYHAHFATSGPLVVLYNLCRVVFIFYLFWIVHAAGSLALSLLRCERPAGTGTLEWLAVGFFAGAGVWHVGMLGLGFLSLYTPHVAILLTLPLVVLSTSHVRCAWSELAIRLAPLQPGSLPSPATSVEAVVATCLTAALGASLLMLLLVKGLYPAGGHDYFLHYFPYLQSVIARGNLWPNEVWYHFYYSKGAGLYFLGMLLTDPLAPQLVTFCLVAVASIALFQLLSRLAPETWWPHVGVILWLALYIHTPGQGEYRLNGGWGDFEKLHELNAALVAAVIWLTANALARGERVWWVAAACAIVAAVIINVTISIYFGAVFATLSAWLLFRRRWRLSRNCLLLTVTAGLALLSLLGINYAVTGLINDQGVLTLWKYADVEKLYQLGTLPWVIYLHQGTTGMLANSMPFGMPLVDLLINSLRLDLLYPLVGGGVLLFALALLVRRAVVRDPVLLAFLLISILACIVLTSTAGRAQPISFFRYASFTCIVSIAFGTCCWGNLSSRHFGRRQALGLVLPALVLWATWHGAAKSYQPGAFSAVASQAWRFARGAYSIDQAYVAQTGWPGRLPWGGIHPGARGAYSAVGPGVPIRSMHAHSYCMLPDCRMQTFPAFTTGRDWDVLTFGTPEQGREVLQQAGLNYFLFSRSLAKTLSVPDVLPNASLFRPENIASILGVKWTDGDTVLLTWLAPGIEPLDQAWIADYKRALEQTPPVASAQMEPIFRSLRATPHPWHSFKLPW